MAGNQGWISKEHLGLSLGFWRLHYWIYGGPVSWCSKRSVAKIFLAESRKPHEVCNLLPKGCLPHADVRNNQRWRLAFLPKMASNNFDGRIVWPLSFCMWVSTCCFLSTLSGSLLLDLLVSFIIQIYLYIVHTVYFGKFHWCYHDVWFPNGTANVNCILSTLCPQGKTWQSAVDGKLHQTTDISHGWRHTISDLCACSSTCASDTGALIQPPIWKNTWKSDGKQVPFMTSKMFSQKMLKIKSSTWRLLALYVKKNYNCHHNNTMW